MKTNSIRKKLLIITLMPVILMALVSVFTCIAQITIYSTNSSKMELHRIYETTEATINVIYPGEYHLVTNGGNRTLYKGDIAINGRMEILDILKTGSGLEYTISCYNKRVATTLSSGGEYLVGTEIPEDIWLQLSNCNPGETIFENIAINGEQFYAYYVPIFSSGGDVIGSIFIGQPISDVRQGQLKTFGVIMGSFLVLSVLTVGLILSYGAEITNCILEIQEFVDDIANEKFNRRLPDSIFERQDELGSIGRDITIMRNTLRDMIELDGLTGLYNKRTGNKKFEGLKNKCKSNKKSYSLAMGDIDFFKKVNDTYGHDAGDVVLKTVASIIKKNMKGCGFVARWGGEEFMIGFEGRSKEKAKRKLEEILNEIRGTTVQYEDQIIKVTMTYGIAGGNEGKTLEDLMRIADARLYIGKEGGRNQIVIEG